MPQEEPQIPGNNQGQQEQIDPTALTLSRAIRSTENTGYDQTVQEPNGTSSFGAYGWNGDNFQKWAKQYGLNPGDTSEVNQDHLAYLRIKDMLDKGMSQSDVAATWNGAHVENGQIMPNNPAYVDKVKNYYQQHSQNFSPSSGGYITNVPLTKTNQPQQDQQSQDLGTELSGRVSDLGGAVSQTMSGQINPISGLIQAGGAIAGGIGDIVGKGLELIPGVKQIEGLIGQGVQTIAKTQAGQAVLKSVQDFSTQHPELSKDIGAGFNILTAIPILKGLSLVKGAAMDAVASALKPIAVDAFDSSMSTVAKTAGKGAVSFMEDNPGIFKEAAERGMIPDIENVAGINKYRTSNIINSSWDNIQGLNSKVKEFLSAPKFTTATEDPGIVFRNTIKGFTDLGGDVHPGFPNAGLFPEDLIANAKRLNPENRVLWDKFANGRATMADINTLRSDLDSSVKSVYTTWNEPPFSKDLGAQLASAMRDYVQNNAPETQELFSEMTKQFKLQKAFSYIENKSLKSGFIGSTVKNLATGLGEKVGEATGVPFAGALVGRGVGGMVGRRLTGGIEGLLSRQIPSRAAILSGLGKGLGKAVAGTTAQNLSR